MSALINLAVILRQLLNAREQAVADWHPESRRQPRGTNLAVLLHLQPVRGNLRKFYERKLQTSTYHHILDRKTGYPVGHATCEHHDYLGQLA